MIVTCVYVHVKPEMVVKFIDASVLNQQEAVKEPGNFRFDFLQMSDDPCRFIFYEAYSSEEAAAAHKSAPHYLKWRDTVAEMMAEPRKGVKYNMLQPVR
jgi:(4S)-4-hydroxy-5-phosphonooxypentane-2,3-dione isomerase